MSYEILDINTVARYAKGVKAISDVLGDGEYIAKEVGDGNLNLAGWPSACLSFNTQGLVACK